MDPTNQTTHRALSNLGFLEISCKRHQAFADGDGISLVYQIDDTYQVKFDCHPTTPEIRLRVIDLVKGTVLIETVRKVPDA